MNSRIRIVTEPTSEPISLTEALVHCRIEPGVEDKWFLNAIKTARRIVEGYQWRSYVTQTVEVSYDKIPNTPIELPRSPVSSVTSITLYDNENSSTVLDLSNFYIDTDNEPVRIILNYGYSWPSITLRSIDALRIRFTAGYGNSVNVPENVKQAMLLYIGYLYENHAGEITKEPEAVYNLVRSSRMYTYDAE